MRWAMSCRPISIGIRCPYDLHYQLPPAPYGCRYILVDGDILLIGATGLVLDALLVLSSY